MCKTISIRTQSVCTKMYSRSFRNSHYHAPLSTSTCSKCSTRCNWSLGVSPASQVKALNLPKTWSQPRSTGTASRHLAGSTANRQVVGTRPSPQPRPTRLANLLMPLLRSPRPRIKRRRRLMQSRHLRRISNRFSRLGIRSNS